MKTVEDKLRFKNHFFKLGQGRVIPEDQKDYWAVLWKEPENSDDIYELLTPYDVRTIRDQNRVNFLLLVYILSKRLIAITNEIGDSSKKIPINELLNCIRFLTKLLPFLFELPDYASEIEDRLFWVHSFDPIVYLNSIQDSVTAKGEAENATAVQLIRSSVILLFLRGFTLEAPRIKTTASNKVLSVWEPGIGNSSKYATPNLIVDSNRSEVLKLLLTLCSVSFYQSPATVIASGSRFMTLLVATTPRVELLTLVCSLTNLVCRSARSLPEDNVLVYTNNSQLTEMRHLCVTYSVQLLTAMVVYPLPANENLLFLEGTGLVPTPKPSNMARVYMGKLHKESELLFLGSYLINILKQPVVNTKDAESNKFNIIKSGNQPSLWATEATMLIWELVQCNKRFRSLIAEKFLAELMVVLLFYVYTFSNNQSHKNLVRICTYLMLYFSSDTKNLDSLLEPININLYDSLPTTFKINPAPITTRDFIVTQTSNLLLYLQNPSTSYTYNAPQPISSIMTTLVEIQYNLIPASSIKELNLATDPAKKLANPNPQGGLSYSSCSAITLLISKFSSREFLQEKAIHADLLALLVRAVCTAILKYPKPSRMLLFSILKNEKVYDQVWNTIYSFRIEYFNGNKLSSIDDRNEEEQESSPMELEKNILSTVNSNTSDRLSITSQQPSFHDGDIGESNVPDTPPLHKTSVSSMGNNGGLNLIVDSSPEQEIENSLRPRLPTGMSEKAREKLPKESPLNRTWGGNDALRIILTIVIPHLKVVLKEIWSSREGSSVDSYLLVKQIEATDFKELIDKNRAQINYDFLPESPLDPLKFTWSHLSLGWYTSLLYGAMYNSVDAVRAYSGNSNKIMKNITTSIASVSKLTSSWTGFMKTNAGSSAILANDAPEVHEWVRASLTVVNQWNHTAVKLFRIQNSNSDGILGAFNKLGGVNQAVPSTPGGVNDMASHLVRRLSDFRLNNTSRASMGSIPSGLTTPVEEQEPSFGKFQSRNSVTSLHSLNTLNRSRSNTPRNSIS
ncbi:protein putatively [Scheffersomyces xylosifermentans]|uniref:protein putatively n=1 Tax=Scheffersomyces xylosifermentans TaxID=1304137 RepID=UPI00315D3992